MQVFLFWLGYIVCAIWVQHLVPGVDFMTPGLIVSMQRESRLRTLWLALAFILLQEGMGSLAFGYGALFYGGVVLLYFLGGHVFESANFLFMCLLGVGQGVLHLVLIRLVAALQEVAISGDELIRACVLQAIIFPAAWALTRLAHSRILTTQANNARAV
jgi:hypothetical protein